MGTLLRDHGKGTVASTALPAQNRVHRSHLDHIDRADNDRSTEACLKDGSEVAGEVICHEVGLQEGILDEVTSHQLSTVDDGIMNNTVKGHFPQSLEPFLSGSGLVSTNKPNQQRWW